MYSQATKSSINQINNQQSNFIFLQSLSSSLSSSSTTPINIISTSSDHQNHQLYQQHQQHIWQKPPSPTNQNQQNHRRQRFHWHQYPKPESSTISTFFLVKNQYNQGKGANLHQNFLTKLLQPNLRPSMNFLLTILILNLINRVPSALATNQPDTKENANNLNINNNLIKNPYDIINNKIYEKEITLNSNSLGNLDDDFSLTSLTHSRPVLLSPSPELSESSSESTLLSQSSSPLSSSSSSLPASSSPSSSPSSSLSSSLSSPLSSTQPSSPVSPGSYYSFISSHQPTQLSHYYLQINKPQQSPPPPITSSSTTTPSPPQQQSTYNNNNNNNNNKNNANELNIKTAKDFESLFHRIARRSSRPYDVPQIECPVSEDGVDRFACPTPNKEGRYRCIEDHELCNGFNACPNAEDEDRKLCMFYKTTKAHLDVLADAMLRMVRERF